MTDLLWLPAAYALGLGASRVGLPPLVGYLAAGLALATAGVRGGALLHELADLGVLLLLFTVGLKLRLRGLLRPEVWAVGTMQLVLVGSAATALWLALGLAPPAAAFLGLGLAFSSTVLAAKALDDRHELGAFHGRVAMGILVFQDVVAVALMTLLGAHAASGWALLLLALPLARPLAAHLMRWGGHDELLLLFGVTFALGSAALFEGVGIPGELGALAAGMLLLGLPRADELGKLLWGLREVFLVAFFVAVGLVGLPEGGALVLALGLALLLPLKLAPLLALLVAARLRARSAFLTGLALASHSEFALIAAQAGVDSGLLAPEVLALLGLAVVLSFAVAAPLNRAAHTLFDRWEPLLVRFERPGGHPDEAPESVGSAHALVVGMGRTGTAAYRLLREAGQAVAGLDSDPASLERHLALGHRVRYGDAEDPELWARLRLDEVHLILLTVPDFEARLRAASGARAHGFRGVISATSYHPEEEAALQRVGVDLTFNPLVEAGARLAQLGLEALARPEATPAPGASSG